MSDAAKESLKELGRLILLAIISFLLTEGTLGLIFNALGLFIDPEIRLVVTGLLTTVLRTLDKYIHESPETKSNGLIPF